MCTVCFYILAVKAELLDVERKEAEITILSEWWRPTPNTLLSIRIPVTMCPPLLFAQLLLHFPSSGNFFPPFEMSPTTMSSSSHLLTERKKPQMHSEKIPCFSLARKIQLLFHKCSLFIVVALKHTHRCLL